MLNYRPIKKNARIFWTGPNSPAPVSPQVHQAHRPARQRSSRPGPLNHVLYRPTPEKKLQRPTLLSLWRSAPAHEENHATPVEESSVQNPQWRCATLSLHTILPWLRDPRSRLPLSLPESLLLLQRRPTLASPSPSPLRQWLLLLLRRYCTGFFSFDSTAVWYELDAARAYRVRFSSACLSSRFWSRWPTEASRSRRW